MAWTLEKWSFRDDRYTDKDFVKRITKDITETAGFIPLAVRFKQMEQAGLRARFFESEFTSHDFSDMYLNHPEFDIMPDDDLEDVIEKTKLRENYIMEVKKAAQARNAARVEKGNEEPQPRKTSIQEEEKNT